MISDFHKKISRQVSDSQLQMSKNALISGMDKFMHFIQTASSQPERFMQTSARDFAYSLARLYMGEYIDCLLALHTEIIEPGSAYH